MPNEVCIKVSNAYRVDRRNEFCARQFNEVKAALEALELKAHVFTAGSMMGRECNQEVTYLTEGGAPKPYEAGWGFDGVIGDAYYGSLEVLPNPYFTQSLSYPTAGHKRIVKAVWNARWFSAGALGRIPSGATINKAHFEIKFTTLEYRAWESQHVSHWALHDENCPPDWCSGHDHARIYDPPDGEPRADHGLVMLIAIGETVDSTIHALGWSEFFNATEGDQKVVDITDVIQKLADSAGSTYKNIGLLSTGKYWDYGAVNGDSEVMKGWLPSASSPLLLWDEGNPADWGCCVCSSKGVDYDYGVNISSDVYLDFTLPNSIASRRIPWPANYPAMT